MNRIDIIKAKLNKIGHTWGCARVLLTGRCNCGTDAALAALDSLTVKVSDEEIERMAKEACLKFLSQPVDLNASKMFDTPTALYALRHARDKWLAPSQWIKTSERLPESEKDNDGWSLSVSVLGTARIWPNDEERVTKICFYQIDPQGHIRWIELKPDYWQPLPEPPNPNN